MEYLFLFALCAIFFYPTLKYGYVVDDSEHQKNMKIWYKSNSPKKFWQSITYGCLGICPKWVDHAITTFLNFVIASLICALFNPLSAIIYTIHPTNHQLTLWLNGRRYQLALILGLISTIFPFVGFIAFPMGMFIHVSILPFVFISAIINQTWLPILWALPALFAVKHIKAWIKRRYSIQPTEVHKKFEWGKIILSIKCLSSYWKDTILPTKLSMFNEEYWGLELEGNRKNMYSINAHFWLSVAFLLIIHVGVWLIDRSFLKWAFLFDLSVLQWLPLWKNPVQLYASRYASIAMVFGCLLLSQVIPQPWNMLYLGYIGTLTLNNMGMYKNVYSYFFLHMLHQPNNMAAHWYAIHGFNNQSMWFQKTNKQADALMNDVYSRTAGFLWVLNHKHFDMIHEEVYRKFQINYEERK